ncbi:hypothetical protein PP428_gp054 [Escherichia phage vB_EcoM_RZ]|uniref:Uncharacterized protein n=1 Tax=Escherichia phage vB_EcoM_RZ TaxID=2893954 RepID=A0AAE8YI84_9CAUD|nr:hypothetical protein PP428_gp054 [Escherichia phage vB_EcoM_RZ]UGL59870.1 hypothetical protein [Escherichia phage vB_EcoM_RZ]
MISWLKNLFKTKPGEGVVPVSLPDVKLREYVYMGDGMMEEVVKSKSKDLYSTMSEEDLQKRLTRLQEQRTQAQSSIDTASIVVTAAAVSSWTGDSSYSSYDSGSCDSSSSSCD